jgi:hypothetical protein
MSNDNKIKHLEFIQNVITRMNSNSFIIKSWCITLVSALFAFTAKDSNISFALITYIVIPCFWILDGFFIYREKDYRDLYEIVRNKNEEEIDFDMKPANLCYFSWLWDGILTKTLIPFYGIMIIATILILLLM